MDFSNFIAPGYISNAPVGVDEAINLLFEPRGGNKFRMKQRPGYTLWKDTGANKPARGNLALNDHYFIVFGDTLYDYLSDTTLNASYPGITEDGQQVRMAASFYQLALVFGETAYFIEAGTLAPVSWLAGIKVIDVGYINRKFVFLAKASIPLSQPNGFYYSEPGDVDSGDASNFTPAESSANEYKRLLVHDEKVWLVGDQQSLPFYDQSSSVPEDPFAPDLSSPLSEGIAAPASLTSLGGSRFWIGRNQQAQGIAWQSTGAGIERISTFDVEERWRRYSTIEDAIGMCVSVRGNWIWRVLFPTANESWDYNTALPKAGWTKTLFYDEDQGAYHADRAICAAEIFGKVLVGDRLNGKILEFTPDALDDNGDRIRCLRRAPPPNLGNRRITFPYFELIMETGNGDGSNADPDVGAVTPEANPEIMFRFSRNNGKTWSNERRMGTGKQGEYDHRVIWRRNGTGNKPVFEISWTASRPMDIQDALIEEPR